MNCKASLINACQDVIAGGGTPAPLSLSLAGLDGSCNPIASKLTQDKSGLPFQGLFPVNTTGSVLTDLPSTNTVRGGLAKVNYHLNDKNQLEGMYFISQGDNVAVDSPVSEVSSNWISAQHARSQAVSADWAFTPNSSVVNEVRFGYAHYYQTFFGTDASQNAASYNFNGQTYQIPTGIDPNGPAGVSYGGAPNIRFQGFYAFPSNGIGVGWPKIVGPDGVVEFLDHVSILKGKHAFKFGGEYIHNESTTNETANAKRGVIRFGDSGSGAGKVNGLTNFMEGNIKQGALFLGNAQRTLYNQGYAAFLQDDWRIKPRLTLNLGVRYELNTVVHERDGLMGNFDPTLGLVQTNNPYHGDHNNFSPRIGFAWDVQGNGKTVVRAGGGIIYEQLSFDVMNGEGNLLGLRTFPTGLPLYNAGSTTPLPLAGNIQLQSLNFAAGSPTRWPGWNHQQTVAKFQSHASCSSTANSSAGVSEPALRRRRDTLTPQASRRLRPVRSLRRKSEYSHAVCWHLEP